MEHAVCEVHCTGARRVRKGEGRRGMDMTEMINEAR